MRGEPMGGEKLIGLKTQPAKFAWFEVFAEGFVPFVPQRSDFVDCLRKILRLESYVIPMWPILRRREAAAVSGG
jgi:hypothetical protein